MLFINAYFFVVEIKILKYMLVLTMRTAQWSVSPHPQETFYSVGLYII